ncbi:MAG: hypothetical protein ACK5PS_05210 [Desulfopila sp.]
MEEQKRHLEKILQATQRQIAEEVTVLLGGDFSLEPGLSDLVEKEQFFQQVVGKQVVSRIDITGERAHGGALVIGIKDAIRLGATLLMLPQSELEEAVGRETFAGETADSYGEIASTVVGSLAGTLQELHNESIHCTSGTPQVVAPQKAASADAEPIANQRYYRASWAMKLAGRELGEIHLLLPASLFDLSKEDTDGREGSAAEEGGQMSESEALSGPGGTGDEESGPRKRVTTGATPAGRMLPPPKQQRRIDGLLELCKGKLEEDLTSLVGAKIKFVEYQNRLISKKELFATEVQGNLVIGDIEIVGDLQGASYVLTDCADAVRLGGLLVMLPTTELERVIAEEQFGEDVEDAFGEVVNIASGMYSATFEDRYPQKIRFVKKRLRRVAVAAVEPESDDPIPDQLYYMSRMTLVVDGQTCGGIRLVFPAALFHLDPQSSDIVSESEVSEDFDVDLDDAVDTGFTATDDGEGGGDDWPAEAGKQMVTEGRHRDQVNRVLKECAKTMQEEIGTRLGSELRFADLEHRYISKQEFFFEIASGKQVVTRLKVTGADDSAGYLVVNLADAAYLSGSDDQLAADELEFAAAAGGLDGSMQDGFGEIATIVARACTGVFARQYSEEISFSRDTLDVVSPLEVDIGSTEPIPDVEYYMSSMSLAVGDEDRGRIYLLFPSAVLNLDQVQTRGIETEKSAASAGAIAEVADDPQAAIDILIISNDRDESQKFIEAAFAKGLAAREVTFKDNVKMAISQELKAIYIVMREVNEQAFSMVIKVSSSCSLPLIASGPNWTRSKVIKAVKYGVDDILLSPATPVDIEENLEAIMVAKAA